jgi:fructose-1,6-bisphosphatase/sedoheptulose 1,7-bisphosphatase-like protein
VDDIHNVAHALNHRLNRCTVKECNFDKHDEVIDELQANDLFFQ